MKQPDNTTTLWALDVVRRYAPAPLVDTADYHVECFRRQCERDAALREAMAEREEEPADHDPRSMEQWFEDEQAYHGSDRR